MKRLLMMLVVLCALQAAPLCAALFTNNGNGTVTDSTTGLMWQQGEAGWNIWTRSKSYCEGLSLGGQSGWRLPTITELTSLIDLKFRDPTIDTTYFPGTVSSNYWSSTAYLGNLCWTVYFGTLGSKDGVVKDHIETNYYTQGGNIRCVRSLALASTNVPADKKGGPSCNKLTKFDSP